MTLALGVLAVLGVGFDRVLATFTAGRVDHWIAFLTLTATLVLAWWLSAVWGRGRREEDVLASVSGWAIAWREFKKNRPAVLGLYLMVALYLVTLLAPYLTSYDPTEIVDDIISVRHLAPSGEHLLGTDKYGRDVYTRILYGARISLSIGFVAVVISITLGTLVGAVSGYFGGVVDTVLMRLVDTLISFPRLVLLITVIALFEPSILVVVIVLGLTLWPSTARIVRGEVLSLREREFIEAARALGLGSPRIILRHIIPNVMGPVIVAATLGLGNIILIEAGLSFLGLSVQPPTPSWGAIINDGREFLLQAWWVSTFPGLAIVFTVVAFNLIGDGLRDALDPRLRM
ncbi:MAG: ABC transporter permease subunit [Gemmatimonadetes bacterium]|nr:ABC transporter permease subunit [Gemmatimonadota bacterium]NIO31828.1 ABC transporter permease subunit [Gemmatimonadota bacterium]